jgi:hypothetical protein
VAATLDQPREETTVETSMGAGVHASLSCGDEHPQQAKVDCSSERELAKPEEAKVKSCTKQFDPLHVLLCR